MEFWDCCFAKCPGKVRAFCQLSGNLGLLLNVVGNVREFSQLSGNFGIVAKCEGNIREFCHLPSGKF